MIRPVHEPAASRFVIVFPQGEAVLDYELDGNRVVFTHTLVPPALRGRGLAELLVREAFAWVEASHRTFASRCSFVDRFLARHPEFARLQSPG